MKTNQRPHWFTACDKLHRKIMTRAKCKPYGDADGIHLVVGLVGEAGEVANELKKYMRTGCAERDKFVTKMRGELADVRIYLELVAHWLRIDLDQAVIDKREIVERRWKRKGL